VRTATPARAEELRREMEQAEDEFVVRVEEAMTKMRAVLENPEPLKCLADLVAAQLAYFKEAHLVIIYIYIYVLKLMQYCFFLCLFYFVLLFLYFSQFIFFSLLFIFRLWQSCLQK